MPERVAMAGAHAADAMAHVDAIDAARALHRPVMHREDHALRPGAAARPRRATACAGAARSARTRRRKNPRPAATAAPWPAAERRARRRRPGAGNCSRRAVLQQQRRRPGLAGLVAALEEIRVVLRIATRDAHRLVPAIGDLGEPRIERGAQLRDQIGQRIGEIFVFAAAEAVPRHDDAAAEQLVLRIAPGERRAFLRGQQRTGQRRSPACRDSDAIAGQSRASRRARLCAGGDRIRRPLLLPWTWLSLLASRPCSPDIWQLRRSGAQPEFRPARPFDIGEPA